MTFRTPLAALAVASLVVLAPGAPAPRAQPAAETGTITVGGRAELVLAPDRAAIDVGVVTVDASARAAMAENKTRAAALIAAARAAGIEDRDIQTVQFQVNPRYAQFDRSRPDGQPEIVGYEVVNEISVVIRAIADTGAVLDALLSSGANRAGSIRFMVSDLDVKLDAAREEAVRDARRKAELYARAAGASLGAIESIDEAGTAQPRPPMPYERAAMVQDAAVPIQAGSQTASAGVTVTWKLQQ